MMIADNLGLTVSATEANSRLAASLGITADKLTDAQKKGAFLAMMLEEGEKKMEALGETTLDSAAKLEQSAAAWDDTKSAVGEAVLALGEAIGIMDAVSKRSRDLAKLFEAIAKHGLSVRASMASWKGIFDKNRTMIDFYVDSLENQAEEEANVDRWLQTNIQSMKDYQAALDNSQQAIDNAAFAAMQLARAEEVAATAAGSIERWDQYQDALDSTGGALDKATRGVLKLARAEEVAKNKAQAHSEFLFQASTSFTDYYRRAAEQSELYVKNREDLEKEHQETLADLVKKGQGRAKRIDAAAEQEKLEELQRKLQIALQQESEFTDKTKASTKMRKEDQLRSLREQIGQQEGMLGDYHAGRLRTTGQNVSDLLAKENERYEQEMTMLQESRAAQEAEQRQSLGRMVLQHFTSWAQIQGLTADETLKMQMDISTKYGLIEEAAASHVRNMAQNWSSELSVMRGEATGFFDAFTQQFNSLPSEHVIKIRYDLAARPQTTPGRQGGEAQALGSSFAPGGGTLVGEYGAEIVQVPRGARVLNDADTRRARRGGGGVRKVEIHNHIMSPDPEWLARQLEDYMRLKNISTGPLLGR